MKVKNIVGLALGVLGVSPVFSQVISVLPVFPKEQDTVTILYDATQGNAALVGVSQVYAHAGVITNQSTSASDWKHVVGNWGTADNRVKMVSLGNNKWQLKYHLKNFYAQAGAFVSGEIIEQMAFVFRNADGSKVGRSATGGDIYSSVYSASSGFLMKITQPDQANILVKTSDVTPVNVWISKMGKLFAILNGDTIYQKQNADSIRLSIAGLGVGMHKLKLLAFDGVTWLRDSINFVVNPTVKYSMLPSGMEQGINVINDSTVCLALYAPQKQYVYVIGDFNEWLPDTGYFMNYSPNNAIWWKVITGLKAQQEYGFQYWVDGKIRVSDPFATLMLHDWDDAYISKSNYPNLKPYPKTKTTGYVSVFRIAGDGYQWKNSSFNRVNKDKLVIYELLLRDFTSAQSFKAIQDTLPYLKRLGITALQFMPLAEFEGNLSWGYNPASHMALDKYYGTSTALKELIDACHGAGIAVILDVVYNHAFSNASICKLYWDDAGFKPTSSNPWANVEAKHPFNVGYDLNHESLATKYYTKQTLKYWLEEFKFDGFRFDLSKGLTQTNYGTDVGKWGGYDQGRINILSDYNDFIQSVSPGAYVILEHFADNSEEQVLQGKGMMLWGNANHQSVEAAMGYVTNSDFGWGFDNTKRGWSYRHLIGYACSHDEERLGYKCKNFGFSANGQHNVKSQKIYSQRIGALQSFLFAIPGPKMLWQFDELTYDYSINHCTNGSVADACRLDPKPVRWDYWTKDGWRQQAYYRLASVNQLKVTRDEISSPASFNLVSAGNVKRLNTYHNDLNMVALHNVDIANQSIAGNFPRNGWWYDYLSGDSIQVSAANQSVTVLAGETKLYLDKKVINPLMEPMNRVLSVEGEMKGVISVGIYPNPSATGFYLRNETGLALTECVVFDLQGRELKGIVMDEMTGFVSTEELVDGTYFMRIFIGQEYQILRFVVAR
jgi:1,4-alpha-glucan branching enzyme